MVQANDESRTDREIDNSGDSDSDSDSDTDDNRDNDDATIRDDSNDSSSDSEGDVFQSRPMLMTGKYRLREVFARSSLELIAYRLIIK